MNYFMKQPCKHCPYRHDVKPFLRRERGIELAEHAYNPYNTFTCHKTLEYDEDEEGEDDTVVTEESKECAGFLSLQINEGAECPEGFKVSDLAYSCVYDMIDVYEQLDR